MIGIFFWEPFLCLVSHIVCCTKLAILTLDTLKSRLVVSFAAVLSIITKCSLYRGALSDMFTKDSCGGDQGTSRRDLLRGLIVL